MMTIRLKRGNIFCHLQDVCSGSEGDQDWSESPALLRVLVHVPSLGMGRSSMVGMVVAISIGDYFFGGGSDQSFGVIMIAV